MKVKHKVYLRINLMSILFIVISLISVTLAWFAYSGLSEVGMDVNVKAWYIELKRGNTEVKSDIDISLSDIYPGMETKYETIVINNKGDSDAQIDYSIVSARILDEDNYVVSDSLLSTNLENILSHDYPFHINISLSKYYAKSKEENIVFTVSVSWPLDSNNDSADSVWGKNAYDFQNTHPTTDSSIQIKISLKAEQHMGEDTAPDTRFPLGGIVYYDPILNQKCLEESGNSNCFKTYVIDRNNKIGDEVVNLLPEISNYNTAISHSQYSSTFSSLTSSWTANKRSLTSKDILSVVSTNIVDSLLIRPNLSDTVIGNIKNQNTFDTEILKATSSNGMYSFNPTKFPYLASNTCYWTSSNYKDNIAFAVKSVNNKVNLYGEDKNTNCIVVPVIIATKNKF